MSTGILEHPYSPLPFIKRRGSQTKGKGTASPCEVTSDAAASLAHLSNDSTFFLLRIFRGQYKGHEAILWRTVCTSVAYIIFILIELPTKRLYDSLL